MKYVAVFVLGAIFSALWMRWQSSATVEPPKMESSLHQLTEEDFKEYLRLKDDKEKLAKAEEIFSKIIVLMLYDIGVKISKPVQDAFQRPVEGFAAAPAITTSETFDTRGVSKVATLPKAQVPSLVAKPLDEVADLTEADRFVESQQLDPSKIPSTNFQQANTQALRTLEGQFEGLMRSTDGSIEIRVEIDLNVQERRNPPTGVYSLRLFKGADLFSNSRGRGDLSNFQSANGVPSVWIEEGGRTYRFQIFYFPRLNVWKANAYKKDRTNKWSHYSRFDLQKI